LLGAGYLSALRIAMQPVNMTWLAAYELDGRSYRDPKVPPVSKKQASKAPVNTAK
jgi:hypothetical protein